MHSSLGEYRDSLPRTRRQRYEGPTYKTDRIDLRGRDIGDHPRSILLSVN
jgi:hypothetical protein